MRLEVTRRTDLATRALVELAQLDERIKAADLAERIGTSPGFLSQAVAPLTSNGWVRSDPGPTGGYRIDVDPADLSILDVIEAVEGPTDTGACVLEDRPCRGQDHCALHVPWTSARAQLLRQLSATSLAELVAGTT